MEIIKVTRVNGCYHKCPFYASDMDGMRCSHPYFDNANDSYESMIISQDNSRGGKIPQKCPLRNGELKIKHTIRLSNRKLDRSLYK